MMRWFVSLLSAFACFSADAVFSQMIDRTPTRVQTTLKTDWKQIGTIRQKSVPEVDSSPWSIGCETLCRDYIDYNLYKEYLVPLGIKLIRLQGGWAKTEKEKGVYDFKWLDTIIDDALARGLTVWLETDYGNPIYEGGGGADLQGGFPTSEKALAAWDKWVEAAATRYKDKVKIWAMWNEPDINPEHKPVEIADFNIRTAEIIKRIIPDARIGALSLARNKPEFLEECMQRFAEKDKTGLFEWLIYHGYAANPDSSYKSVKEMEAVVKKYAPDWKLWQGENGCPSEMAKRFALSNIPWSELTQCKWNTRRMLGDRGHDVDISSVFTICDFDHTGREINRKGLLKINDKTSLAKVKMAYYAVQNVVSIFDGTLTCQKDYRCKIEGGKPVTWFAYRNPEERDVLVMWNGSDRPKDDNTTFPVTITVEGGGFKDPVWADIVTGRIHEIPEEQKKIADGKTVLTKIPVYDAPTVIADREILLGN